jgi:glycosyltransferase involved in cell wall biosynthesis
MGQKYGNDDEEGSFRNGVESLDMAASTRVDIAAAVSVDIVIPVFNESRILPATIGTLVAFLSHSCPYDWRVLIADNASTDETPAVVRDLERRHDRVRGVRIESKGRGIALRNTWTGSGAAWHVYMDADLSTGLDALGPLLQRLADGYDIAAGSRHVPHAVLTRSLRRDVLSRMYNVLLRALFRTSLSDAQCGFKAVTRRVVTELVPHVKSNKWFFDTELLVMAERAGYRVAEVPVRWVEDRDSRVNIPQTVIEYLGELWRLKRTEKTLVPAHGPIAVPEPVDVRRSADVEPTTRRRAGV